MPPHHDHGYWSEGQPGDRNQACPGRSTAPLCGIKFSLGDSKFKITGIFFGLFYFDGMSGSISTSMSKPASSDPSGGPSSPRNYPSASRSLLFPLSYWRIFVAIRRTEQAASFHMMTRRLLLL